MAYVLSDTSIAPSWQARTNHAAAPDLVSNLSTGANLCTGALTQRSLVIMHPKALVRAAWAELLSTQADFSVLCEVSDVAEFAVAAEPVDEHQQPVVVFVDLDSGNAPDMNQIATLRSAFPLVRPLIVACQEHDYCLIEAQRLGVQGFLTKNVPAERLFDAIRIVCSGGMSFDVGVLDLSVSELTTNGEDSEFDRPKLSHREQEVLNLVARGETNVAVARQMFISASTVKYHLNSVFQKLGASNRTDAVRIGLKLGLVTEVRPKPNRSSPAPA